MQVDWTRTALSTPETAEESFAPVIASELSLDQHAFLANNGCGVASNHKKLLIEHSTADIDIEI